MQRYPLQLTPTEERLHIVLSDGLAHRVEELEALLVNGARGSLRVHLCNLRNKLEPLGRTVRWVNEGGCLYYMLTRTVATA